MGQKRTFAAAFREMVEGVDDAEVFVDLFGGSGLLSHIAKRARPEATVVYNDFDNYRRRLANVGDTNRLLAAIRGITVDVPQKLAGERFVFQIGTFRFATAEHFVLRIISKGLEGAAHNWRIPIRAYSAINRLLLTDANRLMALWGILARCAGILRPKR